MDYKKGLLDSTIDLHTNLTSAFKDVKDEFSDHLTAINENTNEIQANYEFLCDIDSKINKVEERLEQIQLFLQKHMGLTVEEKPSFEVQKLTKHEQDVFLVLYTLDNLKEAVSIQDLAKKCGLNEDITISYISALVKKGVPITRKVVNKQLCLKLNSVFKKLQAKENILNLNQRTLA